jgi:hypothetical protein
MVVACHSKDNLDRHIVFSTYDNVIAILDESGATPDSSGYIEPLEDGSVVAHYSGKGRAGEYALEKIKQVPGVKLTLLTLPLLYSTFLTWAIPLPNEGNTQWSISAAFSDKAIDLISAHDLAYIVRTWDICFLELLFCYSKSEYNPHTPLALSSIFNSGDL